ncbi:anti-sigma factor antagonist [candidate division KSB1 bacterium]|nr:STAS domain-containing protein [candidate division KSB1 bacterium]RQW07133.1 MAG: anti-sigma factor antagonist [candidate division KSB1 bacterium]
MDTFSISRVNNNEYSILYLNGFLDAHTAPELENEIEKLIQEGRFKIVVNFNDLNYISSAGLGVFMGFIEDIRKNGGDIKMCSMSPKIFRVFDLLGFPTLYDIVEEENKAIELFKN